MKMKKVSVRNPNGNRAVHYSNLCVRHTLLVVGLLLLSLSTRAENILLHQANTQYRHAYHTGYITSVIRFEHNTELRYIDTPARAVPNFSEGTCTVFLSPEAITKLGFDQGSRWRFMIFHEMTHCDLYFSLTTLNPFPDLPAQANLLLSDLLEIEYLFPSGSRQINGYITYHELYADIKAMALMLNEGAAWEDIEPIWLFRRGSLASVVGGHDSEQMLMRVPFYMDGKLLPMNLDNRVRLMIDRYLVTRFIEKAFAPIPQHFSASRQLEGSLRTICSSLQSPWSSAREVSFLQRRLLEGASSPKSLWQEVASLMRVGAECSDVIEHFFQQRYGRLVQQMDDQDKAIATWLSKEQ